MPAPPSLRLEFDLDSEVYPELHAALSSLSSPQARAERLRQLAATGLVWEKVRIHGPTAIALPAAAPQRQASAKPVDVVPPPASAGTPADAASPSPPIERRAPSAKRPRASAPEKRRASDFVDLAIDAGPPAAPPTPNGAGGESWPTRHDLERVIEELPVLLDVVVDDDALVHMPAQGEPAAWPEMGASVDAPPSASEAPAAADSANDAEASEELAEAALHVPALANKPQTRSRLMRMKERGLFKNG